MIDTGIVHNTAELILANFDGFLVSIGTMMFVVLTMIAMTEYTIRKRKHDE